jgi:hypothetical protein
MTEYSRRVSEPCARCGQMTVYCTFDDGLPCTGDQTLTFEHRCSNPDCGYRESRSHHICDGYDTRDDYDCDFCQWNWLAHLR